MKRTYDEDRWLLIWVLRRYLLDQINQAQYEAAMRPHGRTVPDERETYAARGDGLRLFPRYGLPRSNAIGDE